MGLSGERRGFTVGPSLATGMFCWVCAIEAAFWDCEGRAISVDSPEFFSLLPQIPILRNWDVRLLWSGCRVVVVVVVVVLLLSQSRREW